MPILRSLMMVGLTLLCCLGSAMIGGCASPAPAAEKQAAPGAGMPGAAGEELLIIARRAEPRQPADKVTQHASLLARLPNQSAPATLIAPSNTDVKADIAGDFATVSVTQRYHNSFDSAIDALYTFPLPKAANVNEFIMTIGKRKIRGIIREREEAQRIYQAARAQGYLASLLSQEHASEVTQSIANIAPGADIDIDFRYTHALDYVEGWYTYCVPLPDRQSASPLSLAVQLNAGAKIEQIETPGQAVDLKTQGAIATLRLKPGKSVAGEGFLLRYRLEGGRVSAKRPLPVEALNPSRAFISVDATR